MGLPLQTTEISPSRESAPILLPQLEPGFQTFCSNFADLFKSTTKPQLAAPIGVFWPDVFVAAPLPWGRLALSGLIHALALLFIFTSGRLWHDVDRAYPPPPLRQEEVVYFSPSEYLAPFDSGSEATSTTQGDSILAPQPIRSVPADADNRAQTIVTPPDVKLDKEVPLPNMVAWKSPLPAVPVSALSQSLTQKLLEIQPTVVEPPPEIPDNLRRSGATLQAQPVEPAPTLQAASKPGNAGLETSVIEPPPVITQKDVRKVGDVDIGRMEVISPAPRLAVAEQRTFARSGNLAGELETAAVGPAPSIAGISGASTNERLIALGIHPASLTGPVVVPNGNRRGTFEAGPGGKPRASGAPAMEGQGVQGHGQRSSASFKDVPGGLRVGPAPAVGVLADSGTYQGASQVASVNKADISRVLHGAAEVPDEKVTDIDRQVFGDRRFYSMSLNMPNLNSSGGSWVIRFAELASLAKPGELSAPAAIQKVDPAYPLALMRENVHGTVTVRAIIRRDGSVGDVQVVRSIDDRLDQYACEALTHWQFQPALKNGMPVDIQAVVLIPFRPGRLNSF